jgi:hypothetical protein
MGNNTPTSREIEAQARESAQRLEVPEDYRNTYLLHYVLKAWHDHFDDEADTTPDPDEPDPDEGVICYRCGGSGEGMHEGGTCVVCGGSGDTSQPWGRARREVEE